MNHERSIAAWAAHLDAMEAELSEHSDALASERPPVFDGRIALAPFDASALDLGPLPESLRGRAEKVLARTRELEEQVLATAELIAREAGQLTRSRGVGSRYGDVSAPNYVDRHA